MEKRPHLLAQNRRLSVEECQRALVALNTVATTLDGREKYVETHGLDPAFALPDSNWGPTVGLLTFLTEYAQALRSDPKNFNFFRLNAQIFSGFDLYTFTKLALFTPELASSRPRLIVQPVRDDIDEYLLGMLNAAVNDVARWLKLIAKSPLDIVVNPPPICGEIGWDINSIIVNEDTAAYQERITLMEKLGLFRFLSAQISKTGAAHVLEIGGGYGALAHQIKKQMPNVSYTICDLPESLGFSAAYLALARPDLRTHVVSLASPAVDALDAFHFLPNYVLPQIAHTHRFDLVINTLSLSEMSVAQIEGYGALISQAISGTGLFFDQNQDNTASGFANCKLLLPRYFLTRTKIDPSPVELTQGGADIWANHRAKIPYDGR